MCKAVIVRGIMRFHDNGLVRQPAFSRKYRKYCSNVKKYEYEKMCCWRIPRIEVVIMTAAAAAMWFACELIVHFPGIHFYVSQIG